jgi:tRNA (guanine-N(7)-)-methyltransferase
MHVPRPTPQRENIYPDTFPRFKDRLPEEYGGRDDVNPYLERHANYGVPLLTADQAWRFRGEWSRCFGREAPLHVEIGPGNGFFLAEVSRRNPDVNVLGLELRYKRTVLCAIKLDRAGVTNARIARYHAGFLDDLFVDSSVSAFYVNHPDPWPKERHEKNRLISRWFLEDAARFLKPGGVFRLKSDYRDNVYRVPGLLDHDGEGEPAEKLPFTITGICEDVITQPAPWPDDIETNYQSK